MESKFYLEINPYSYTITNGRIIIEPNEIDYYVGEIILMWKADSDSHEPDLLQGVYDLWIDSNGKLILNQE